MGMSRIMVSARVICYINGTPFAQCTGFNYSIETPIKEVRGVDNPAPQELAPTVGRVTFTMSLLKTTGDGGIEGVGMSAPFQDLPNQRYFAVMLIDRLTDLVIFQSDFNMTTSQAWSAVAKGIVSGTVSAQGIVYNNEIKPVHL